MCAGRSSHLPSVLSVKTSNRSDSGVGVGVGGSGRSHETILSSLPHIFLLHFSCHFAGGSVLERFIRLVSQQNLKGCSAAFLGLALVSARGLDKCFKDLKQPKPSGAFSHVRFKIKALQTVK